MKPAVFNMPVRHLTGSGFAEESISLACKMRPIAIADMAGIVIHSRTAANLARRGRIHARLPANFAGSRHERRVAAITVKLFDLLAPRHRLSDKYRHLLYLAAMVHDAGRLYGAKGHEHSGAAMVL